MKSVFVSHPSLLTTSTQPIPRLTSRAVNLTISQTLSLALLTALATAAPRPTPSSTSALSGEIGFTFYKVPRCGLPDTANEESHAESQNGGCITLDWLRSVAYSDLSGSPHTRCDAKFFADDKCSADKELPAPLPTEKVQTGSFLADCWDDVTKLQPGVGDEDLVKLVNMTVTCY